MEMHHDIVIAEDEPTQAAKLSMILTHAGFSVRVAKNGVEALDLIRASKPSLVITDVMMPNMDGAAAIKALERVIPEVPVLVSTGFEPIQRQNSLATGLEALPRLRKPYTTDTLLEKLAGILHPEASPAGNGVQQEEKAVLPS
jgi:DNA-binding NtrC family response regulator